jgi:hypothetical protein
MLHVWLIPAFIVLLLIVFGFYLAVKSRGGSGARTDGRTLMDHPGTDEDLPPGMST